MSQLGEAYSILGQATTAEYNRRRREEEEREKRMMRRQLLATFAQPLVQSAGQAQALRTLFPRMLLMSGVV